MLDDLNHAVSTVQRLPRVRFETGLTPEAARWIEKKHAAGAVHEPGTLAAFLAVQKHRKVKQVFDLGALFGYFTLFALQAFDDAEVTAFEMHPLVMPDLHKNVVPWAKIVHAVMSDEIKPPTKFWVSGFNIYEEPEGGWNNLWNVPGAMKQRGEGNRGRGWAEVPFTTLDAYCTSNAPPDLLKIDVEAYQAKAILGGLGMIAKHRPAIVIELHDADKIARMGTTNRATVQPLLQLGYTAFWSTNFRDKDARFEAVTEMGAEHERLGIMVLVP